MSEPLDQLTTKEITKLILDAIALENEACARVMESYSGFSNDERRIAATAIRARMKEMRMGLSMKTCANNLPTMLNEIKGPPHQ